jgi:hypothetical protein
MKSSLHTTMTQDYSQVRHRRRGDDTKIPHPKPLRTPVPAGPASTARPFSCALGANEFECVRSVSRFTALAKEQESDTDRGMADT